MKLITEYTVLYRYGRRTVKDMNKLEFKEKQENYCVNLKICHTKVREAGIDNGENTGSYDLCIIY